MYKENKNSFLYRVSRVYNKTKISSRITSNGMLELKAPESYSEEEIRDYVKSLGVKQHVKISAKQAKYKEEYSQHVNELIREIATEFHIEKQPIKLQIETEISPTEICDCKLDSVDGELVFNVRMAAPLMYMPDIMVTRFLRLYMLGAAFRYWKAIIATTGHVDAGDCMLVISNEMATLNKAIEANIYFDLWDEKRCEQIIEDAEVAGEIFNDEMLRNGIYPFY